MNLSTMLRAAAANRDPLWSSTVLLLHGDGANNSTTFTDSSLTAATWTATGNTKISTDQSKFGGSSIFFDGNGDYLTSNAAASTFEFGSGNFTIECWIYPTSFDGSGNPKIIYDARPAGTNGAYIRIALANSTGQTQILVSGSNVITGSSPSLNAWTHLALCRSGTSTRLFLNGSQTGSTYTDTTTYLNPSGRPFIGISSANSAASVSGFAGYCDEFRVTKAARYTAAFDIPTAPFPDRGF